MGLRQKSASVLYFVALHHTLHTHVDLDIFIEPNINITIDEEGLYETRLMITIG